MNPTAQTRYGSKQATAGALGLCVLCAVAASGQSRSFDFSGYLFGEPSTLNVFVQEQNSSTGYVVLNGGDTQQPTIPFTWKWGDGAVEDGWFPQNHTYSGTTTNYVVTVIAHYGGGATDSTQVLVRFVPPDIDPIVLPDGIAVSVPDSLVELTSRMPGYGIPGDLTWFDDGNFTIVPRATVEYVLTVASHIETDLVNDDVFLVDGGFRQVVLMDPGFGGMYSLWYTSPVSFAAGDYAFQGTIQWSSFLHEMGHNYTLNFPADYYYGGKIDGCANAIYSESMAQIFQHAAAYELINSAGDYGLSADLVFEIGKSAGQSITVVRSAYEDYLASGMNFVSWNDPGTSEDETFDTFMTIAFRFFVHAEARRAGYRQPAKRMTELLGVFNESLREQYDQHHDTAEADTFRATLMVSALSYGFDADLRDEFRDLGFPISDAIYTALIGGVQPPSVTDVQIENVTLPHTDDYVKHGDDVSITADVSDDDPSFGIDDIEADLAGFGGGAAVPPDSYTDGTATWALASVACDPPDGTVTVTVTAEDAIGNTGSGSGVITSDNTTPGAITAFVAGPAHEEVELTWADPSGLDTNYYGVVVRYDAWGDYPYYATAAPDYPATPSAGVGEALDGLGEVTSGTHAIVPRDIHYYSAFAYDRALNYGPADAGGQDRATNYWLGDVATVLGAWGYNGQVNAADIGKLGGTYGASPPVGFHNAECDVAPTDDGSSLGIAQPDGFIDFEDLMIYAMNFNLVDPRAVPVVPSMSAGAVSLGLAERGVGGEGVLEVALRLDGNAIEVKGLSVVIEYDASELEFVSARASDELSSAGTPVFFRHGAGKGTVRVDIAALGIGLTLGGVDEVAVLAFRRLSEGHTLELTAADLRSVTNERIPAELEEIESRLGAPASFRLLGNLPNPFNPVTKIAYDVPREVEVTIRIYDAGGRLVRTIANGPVGPGRHEVLWNGRNETGEPVGSGVYFCAMEADEFHDSHKMVLLR